MYATQLIHRRVWRRTTAILALAVALALLVPASTRAGGTEPVPVPTLDWQPCQQPEQAGFECATAKVPLDYAAPQRATIELAVIRRPADDPARRIGSLFMNPGGPGGPGTVDLPAFWQQFPAEVRQRFDLVSWDPRGVGDSTAVQCFPNAADERAFFGDVPYQSFPVGDAQQRAWFQRYAEWGRRCAARNGALLEHVGTADTARDLDLLRQAVGDAQMNYLGLSYGTLLGATYANLFPDRVRAMVLDGNVDPVAWHNNGVDQAVLGTGLRVGSDTATARTIKAFWRLCAAARPERCAFAEASPEATEAKWATLLERLQRQPVEFRGLSFTYALAVAFMDDRMTTFEAVAYFPSWTNTAELLQAVWLASQGNVAGTSGVPVATPHSVASAQDAVERYAGDEQGSAVECSDSPNPRSSVVIQVLESVAYRRAGPSGVHWLWQYATCVGWPAVAANRYTGPWNTPTANPLLIIGNTYDPQTPYEGAVAMAGYLSSARLLTVDGYGHTVLLNPSACASEYQARYVVDGTLPPEGTVCQQDRQPFAPQQGDS